VDNPIYIGGLDIPQARFAAQADTSEAGFFDVELQAGWPVEKARSLSWQRAACAIANLASGLACLMPRRC
jgi:hypothetical protein